MNFTREPIIETIVSPKDGFKLLVRNSKGGSTEEYIVDALEVVSFGHAFFFRSLERPKSFLVPVSDYEILEVKEARIALKNVSHERNIKIGGGREAPVRQPPREPIVEREPIEEPAPAEAKNEAVVEQRMDKRRDRRRHRRRRSPEDQEWTERRPQAEQHRESEPNRPEVAVEGGGAHEETKVSSSMFSSLFPPPATLISETLSRNKDKEVSEGASLPKLEEQKKEKKKPAPEDDNNAESSPLHRVVSHANPSQTFSSTHFSPLNGSVGFDLPF